MRGVRWPAAIVVVGTTVAIACSRFGEDSTPSPDDAGADAAGDAAAPPCDGGVHVTETFDGVVDIKQFNGWDEDPDNTTNGTLVITTNDAIEAGVTPPFLLATATLAGKAQGRQFIERTISGRPSRINLAFTVGVGANSIYFEYGCAVFLRSSDHRSSTYIHISTGSGSHDVSLSARNPDGGTQSTVIEKIPQKTSRKVAMEIGVGASDNTISTKATLSGPNISTTKELPPFVVGSTIDETFVECGIFFSTPTNDGGGTAEVAVDDVDLTVCP